MLVKSYNLWLSFVLCFLLFSCKTSKTSNDIIAPADAGNVVPQEQPKEERVNTPQETTQQGNLEELILGDWEWEKTICCGRTPHTETPETLNSTKTLRFQKGGMLIYLSGNEITSTQTYKIGYGLMDDSRPVITIGASRPGLLFIKDDSLIIDYGYVDLQQEYYVRRK